MSRASNYEIVGESAVSDCDRARFIEDGATQARTPATAPEARGAVAAKGAASAAIISRPAATAETTVASCVGTMTTTTAEPAIATIGAITRGATASTVIAAASVGEGCDAAEIKTTRSIPTRAASASTGTRPVAAAVAARGRAAAAAKLTPIPASTSIPAREYRSAATAPRPS
jgi:hypothetical protein